MSPECITPAHKTKQIFRTVRNEDPQVGLAPPIERHCSATKSKDAGLMKPARQPGLQLD